MENNQNKRQAATPTIQVDNDRVRVVEWAFEPGAETGWHVHEWDYVVVPQTDGLLLLENDGDNSSAELHAGQSYYRQAGVSHNVINDGGKKLIFIEIEMKAHPMVGG